MTTAQLNVLISHAEFMTGDACALHDQPAINKINGRFLAKTSKSAVFDVCFLVGC
ncbi:MAG: hypothetical protein V7L29_12120 [Nostoc sp.]|uniref:hypothetical protein n=1 Tax=Nostoc sp. TaxID=1180 RepID=UPI002FEE7E50